MISGTPYDRYNASDYTMSMTPPISPSAYQPPPGYAVPGRGNEGGYNMGGGGIGGSSGGSMGMNIPSYNALSWEQSKNATPMGRGGMGMPSGYGPGGGSIGGGGTAGAGGGVIPGRGNEGGYNMGGPGPGLKPPVGGGFGIPPGFQYGLHGGVANPQVTAYQRPPANNYSGNFSAWTGLANRPQFQVTGGYANPKRNVKQKGMKGGVANPKVTAGPRKPFATGGLASISGSPGAAPAAQPTTITTANPLAGRGLPGVGGSSVGGGSVGGVTGGSAVGGSMGMNLSPYSANANWQNATPMGRGGAGAMPANNSVGGVGTGTGSNTGIGAGGVSTVGGAGTGTLPGRGNEGSYGTYPGNVVPGRGNEGAYGMGSGGVGGGNGSMTIQLAPYSANPNWQNATPMGRGNGGVYPTPVGTWR